MTSFKPEEYGSILEAKNDDVTIEPALSTENFFTGYSGLGSVHATATALSSAMTFPISPCYVSPINGAEIPQPTWLSPLSSEPDDFQLSKTEQSNPFLSNNKVDHLDGQMIHSPELVANVQLYHTTSAPWDDEAIRWDNRQQSVPIWTSANSGFGPISMHGYEAEPLGYEMNLPLKRESLVSTASSTPEIKVSGTPRIKHECPLAHGSTPPSSSTCSHRNLAKRISRTQRQTTNQRRTKPEPEDDNTPGSNGDSTHGGKTQKDKSFACPFYRMDPMGHMECINFKLLRIRDVKQHINRKHTRQTFCTQRGCANPPVTSSCREHSNQEDHECTTLKNHTSVQVVSEEMQNQLASPVDRKLTPQQQWYTIWEILFGSDADKPEPFLGSLAEETVGMMKNYWKKEGDEIIRDVLVSRKYPVDCAELYTLKNLFMEVQGRFEQKICHSQRTEQESENGVTNSQEQSSLQPAESDINMQESAALQVDWQMVPDPTDIRPEASTPSMSPWDIHTAISNTGCEDLTLFHTLSDATMDNTAPEPYKSRTSNRLGEWLPDNTTHQQLDHTSAAGRSVNYQGPEMGLNGNI